MDFTLLPIDALSARLKAELNSGSSDIVLGQKSAKEALDAVAADWQRSLRRAGLKG